MGYAYGLLSFRYELFPYSVVARIHAFFTGPAGADMPSGFWMPTDARLNQEGLTEEQRRQLERLLTLGYLSGYERAPNETGIVVYDSAASFEGYNFYTSGHAPVAILMDMQGQQLHTWQYPSWDEWHDRTLEGSGNFFWRRAQVFPNGDVLAIYEGLGLIRIDKESNLIWEFAGAPHHDMEVMEDGSIFVLTRELDKRHPRVFQGKPVVEDFVTILDEKGQLIRQVSILEALANSEYSAYLDLVTSDDIFHTNTLEVLDGRLAGRAASFKAGNVLVCLRNIDAVAIIDLDLETVVWAARGMWRMPHQPTILDNGNMMIFDNQGNHGFSKVIEFDPFTQDVRWAYKGDESNGFRSAELGSSLRLPNGNTLITGSFAGRAFEVTTAQEIVWEFLNPQRAGKDNELIAVIPEMVRLGPDFPLDWLR